MHLVCEKTSKMCEIMEKVVFIINTQINKQMNINKI